MSKNHIVEAFEEGKRIRLKDWLKVLWIKKHSSEQSINSIGAYHLNDDWTFYEYPEQWEIWHEDANGNTTTQPDAIQQAIDLLKANGYEVYKIEKIKM